MVDKKRLIELTRKLIRINSQNPPGNEYRIAEYIKSYLRSLGLTVNTYEFKKNRTNVVAILKGKSNSPSLLISPHLDTVPVGRSWTIDPFSAKIKRGRVYGLGATDCKGNLACALETIRSLIEDKTKLNYELIFAATADEETGSGLGLIPLLEKGILIPDAAIILDADNCDIIITQKGLLHVKLKLQGKRAHGAYPWRGINAIDFAMSIINNLKSHRFSYRKNKYLKPPTINVGTIKGGDKVNIVADWCEVELDFRFLPGMSEKIILKELKSIIRKNGKKFFQRKKDIDDAARIEIENIQEPYHISESHPLVVGLLKVMKSAKIKPLIKGSEGATVITFFQKKNIPAIATGFGSCECAHIADEFVEIENLYKGALLLEEFLKTY